MQLLPLSKSKIIDTINESLDEKSVSELLGDEDLANLLSELTPAELDMIKQENDIEIDSLEALSDIVDEYKENLRPTQKSAEKPSQSSQLISKFNFH